MATPIEAFELVGAGAMRTGLQAFAAHGLIRLVGRQTEIDILTQAMDQANAGHGQVVAVIGEPGVGKTRLFYEFTRSSRARKWLILEGSAFSYGKAVPYFPIRDFLKVYFQIEDRDEIRKVSDKVSGKLATLDATLGHTLPAFLTLLDMPVEEPSWQALEPPQRRQRILDAIKRLHLRASQLQPLILVLENLHWIDSETQAVLDSLLESLPASRILLMVNYRPEYHHRWGSKTYYTQLHLNPLPAARAEALLRPLLGDDPSMTPLVQLLISRTEGNPFFLEESVRTLVETGMLAGKPGAYCLVKTLDGLQVPATVQAVLSARIDRLPHGEKQLLQTAAAIGAEVSFTLLKAILDLNEEQLLRGLAQLQAAEFLYETRLFPELEYTFKHALTHQVAYGNLLKAQRLALHARIVEAIEALNSDRFAAQVERLADHALRGEVWGKAVDYCRQSGEKAMLRSAHRAAVESFEQALHALTHLSEQHVTRIQAIDLRLALRSALLPSGDSKRILTSLGEAQSLAEAIEDPSRLGQVSLFLSDHFRYSGAHEQAIASGQRALTIAEASGEVSLHALANYYLGIAYQARGDYHQAIRCLRQTPVFTGGARRRERFGQLIPPAVTAHANLAACCAELGAFEEGHAFGDRSLRIAEAIAQPGSLMFASWGSGLLSLRQGGIPRALPLLKRAVSICQDSDLPIFFPRIAPALGEVYTMTGCIADAVSLLSQAVEQSVATERAYLEVLCSLPLAKAQMLAGRPEEARTLAEHTLTLACTHQEQGHQAYALLLLGEIATHGASPAVALAEAHYWQALALAKTLGMRPLQAHCHAGLGRLYIKSARYGEARAQLSAAIQRYQAMYMTFWQREVGAILSNVEGDKHDLIDL